MRTLLLLILFSGSFGISAQSKEPMTGPLEDQNYHFTFVIRPSTDDYQYKFKSETDTLEIKKWVDKKTTIIKIKVKKNLRKFFLSNVVDASEAMKIDTVHKPFRSGSSVFLVVRHNFGIKVFNTLDPYYLEKLDPLLKEFNELLPEEGRFPLSFDKQEHKSTVDKDTIITVETEHAVGTLHKKDRRFVCKPGKFPPGEADYFDSIANEKKTKQAIVLRSEQVKTIKSKTVHYINSFTLKDEKFTKSNGVIQNLVITYSVPGFFIGTEINSLEKAHNNKKTQEYMKYINSCMPTKYRLD
jgi:hypothetical protein